MPEPFLVFDADRGEWTSERALACYRERRAARRAMRLPYAQAACRHAGHTIQLNGGTFDPELDRAWRADDPDGRVRRMPRR